MDVASEIQSLQRWVAQALSHAKQCGATQAETSASTEEGLMLKVRQGHTDKVEFTRSQGLGVTVYNGQSKGAASTSDLSEASIKRTVEAAWAIARHTQPDIYAGLAEAHLMATDIPDLDLYHPWALDVNDIQHLAMLGEQAALTHSGVNRCEAFSVATSSSGRVYANSHGLMVGVPASRHSFGCSLIAKQGDEQQRDSWGISARDKSNLPSVEHVAAQAARRVTRRLGARKLDTCRVPVLFDAELASGLISQFLSAISGASLYRKSTFLLDSLGKTVLPAFLDIAECPRLQQGYASAAIDADGLPTTEKAFVRGGRVESYVLGTYSARKLGMTSTANAGGVRNVRLHGGTQPLADLLSTMQRGLWVTELMGQGVNLVTGDYSRGAAGFWVENGIIQYPVHEITIAGNLADMFRQIVGIGDDTDKRGNIHTGSILVEQMIVAGK